MFSSDAASFLNCYRYSNQFSSAISEQTSRKKWMQIKLHRNCLFCATSILPNIDAFLVETVYILSMKSNMIVRHMTLFWSLAVTFIEMFWNNCWGALLALLPLDFGQLSLRNVIFYLLKIYTQSKKFIYNMNMFHSYTVWKYKVLITFLMFCSL